MRTRQRLRLIEACISALHLYGPSRTTIDKVVAIADMSPGIVNFYFDTKAALLIASLEHLAVEFETAVLAPVLALAATPARALEQLIALYLDPDIASPRKVSVWYSFWGEASSRAEYLAICGQRDVAFTDLVRSLITGMIAAHGDAHMQADALALGLVGALEMIWQEIAFREESEIDRPAARARCQAYLDSIFPARRGAAPGGPRLEGIRLLVAAELALAGFHVLRAPESWADYDLIAQRAGARPQTIKVAEADDAACCAEAAADWFALVALRDGGGRDIWVIPRVRLEAGLTADLLSSSRDCLGNFTLMDY